MVLVYYHAKWSVTSMINVLRGLLTESSTQRFMEKTGIVPLLADDTNGNPEIRAALRHIERDAVPVTVLYFPNGIPPKVLPEILPQIGFIDSLEEKLVEEQ